MRFGKQCCVVAWALTAIHLLQRDPHVFPSVWWLQLGLMVAFLSAVLGVIAGCAEKSMGLVLCSVLPILVLGEILDPMGIRNFVIR